MIRRVVSFTGFLLALPLWLLTAPVWVPLAILADVVSRLRRFPTLRLGLFVGVYLAHDWAGMAAAAWLWLTGRFGRRLDLQAHGRVQGWWANSLLRWAGRLLGVRLDHDDPGRLPSSTFIMLSRHASMADAVIPAGLVAGDLDRFAHYVLKRDLRWDPSIDLFASRLDNPGREAPGPAPGQAGRDPGHAGGLSGGRRGDRRSCRPGGVGPLGDLVRRGRTGLTSRTRCRARRPGPARRRWCARCS